MTEQRMAAYRDASWYANPGRSTLPKAHILDAEGESLCGGPAFLGDPMDADRVPVCCRCQRGKCKAAWAEVQQ